MAGATNQQWQSRPTSNGYYPVVSRYAPSLVWDVSGGTGSTGDGALLQQWSCTGGAAQSFRLVAQA